MICLILLLPYHVLFVTAVLSLVFFMFNNFSCLFLRETARSAKRVLAIVILSVRRFKHK